jgi:oxygen-dependent protoporphyrinogen oxidase
MAIGRDAPRGGSRIRRHEVDCLWQAGVVTGRRRHRVAVVGGGIGGLAAAHTLVESADVEVTVFEGSQAVGGKLLLGQVGGVPVDLGAESMLTRRPEALELAREVGLGEAIVAPAELGAHIWTRGGVRALPPNVMGVPANPRAAAKRGILSRRGALRAAVEPRLRDIRLAEDVAVGKLVARRLGPEVRDRMVDPLLGGVYAGSADDLSLWAATPQLAASLEQSRSLVGAVRTRLAEVADAADDESDGSGDGHAFAGIDGGMGRLAREVARSIQAKGASVRFGAMVREIVSSKAGWQVVSGPAARARADNFDGVVVATPARSSGRMLREVAPAAAAELSGIEYASVAIVTLAFDAAALNTDVSGSGFLVPAVDGRTIKAATYSSRKWAWQAGEVVLMRCSIGRHGEEQVLQRDDGDLVSAAVRDLQRATGLRASLLDAQVTRWGGGLPQYAVGHLGRVERIRSALAGCRGLAVCGAYLDGVGIPAVIASGRAAATRVIGEVMAPETMQA